MTGCECGAVILTPTEVRIPGCAHHETVTLRLLPTMRDLAVLRRYLGHEPIQRALYRYRNGDGAAPNDPDSPSRATVYRWLRRAGVPTKEPHRPRGSTPPRPARAPRAVESVAPPAPPPPFAPPYPGFPPEKQRWV